MLDPNWTAPAPCYADLRWPRCLCAACPPGPPTPSVKHDLHDPVSVEDATAMLLSALTWHIEDVEMIRREPCRNDSETEEVASMISAAQRRVDLIASWMVEQLGLRRSEVMGLNEIRNAMLATGSLDAAASSRTLVPEAWRALRLVAGDA